MNISNKIDWRGDLFDVRLHNKDFLNFFAYFFDVGFFNDFFLFDALNDLMNVHGILYYLW